MRWESGISTEEETNPLEHRFFLVVCNHDLTRFLYLLKGENRLKIETFTNCDYFDMASCEPRSKALEIKVF